MNNLRKIERSKAVAIAVDFQEKLMPAMEDREFLEGKTIELIKGLGILDIPILVSQQYTRGLGETVENIKNAIDDFEYVDKTDFSVMGCREFKSKLETSGRKQVILFGIEAHICVLQSCIDLLKEGYEVYLAADCCSSRSLLDKKFGFERMCRAGAVVTTCEALLFQILGGAEAQGFREISKLVK